MVLTSGSPEETEAIGRRLGSACVPGTLIALHGDLGAGKTRFAKGLADGLDIPPSEVTSPTFVLMNLHEGRLPLAHMDLYRLEAVDLPSLGFYDVLTDGVVVVEWAEKAALPADRLDVAIEVTGETTRRLVMGAGGEKSRVLLKVLGG